jgi:cytoskeletal protein CcmA (bactofilin family)
MFNRKAAEEANYPTVSAERVSPFPARDHEPAGLRRANGAPARAIIDAGLCIKGDLDTDGEVQVDGQVKGQVTCAHIIVGQEGGIFGDIKADEVVVRGKVKGTVRAKRVVLQQSAHIEGDIFHEKLTIEEGARFQGASKQENFEHVTPAGKLQLMTEETKANRGRKPDSEAPSVAS